MDETPRAAKRNKDLDLDFKKGQARYHVSLADGDHKSGLGEQP